MASVAAAPAAGAVVLEPSIAELLVAAPELLSVEEVAGAAPTVAGGGVSPTALDALPAPAAAALLSIVEVCACGGAVVAGT